jgi:putative ABC transport system substrate-binding protein
MARDQGAYSRSRRSFCWTLAGVLVAPNIAITQPSKAVRLIGWLGSEDPADTVDVQYEVLFKAGMRDLGYVEGRDYKFETRLATNDLSRLPALAAELVALRVDVIVALTTAAAVAAHKVTREIPIVTNAGDPVGNGLAANLSHPGGNVTGTTSLSSELYVKRVDLLRQLLSGVHRVGFLYNPDNPADQFGLRQFESACNKIAVHPVRSPVRNDNELAPAFQALRQAKVQALVVSSRSMLAWRGKIIEATAKNQLPAVYTRSVFVEQGGLIAYGPDYPDVYRRSASYVDKIFKGARPGDLPIEQPGTYELAINLNTARQLGIKVPEAILLRASKVIE